MDYKHSYKYTVKSAIKLNGFLRKLQVISLEEYATFLRSLGGWNTLAPRRKPS